MRTKMPVKKGGRVFKKGINPKKKMLKSRNEVKIHTFFLAWVLMGWTGQRKIATNFQTNFPFLGCR